MQGHPREQARVDIILHTDAAGLQLTLQHPKSPLVTHTSYTLFLTNITALKLHVEHLSSLSMPLNISHLKQSSLPEIMNMLPATWTVVDVTEYLQDWLFHGCDLWVEVTVLYRPKKDASTGHPMLLFQPTVCVWDDYGDESALKSGDHLKSTLKGFLEARVQEHIVGRLWSGSEQQRKDENEASKQRNKRAIHSQCKVSGLGVKYCHGSHI